MPKVMIGMSGGVDSTVAAYLLQQQGCECIGVTMKLYDGEVEGSCCSLSDVEDAKSVCRRMGIPHYTFNFKDEFDQKVMARFVSEYEAGRTPNPCIACNRYLKFQKLWQRAKELDCDFLATGHYAQVTTDENGMLRLRKSVDAGKDQTYVLYFLDQEQLQHTLFPLGDLTKAEVREIATQQGFVNAKKHDSQDICFVSDGDYGAFLQVYTGKPFAPGDFLNKDGKVLGRHRGAACYTLGQRKGLGVPAETRLYVTGKDMGKNTVTLGRNEELFSKELVATDVFLAAPIPAEGLPLKAKVRYRQQEQPCRVVQTERDTIRVIFDEPQRAITAGQAVVLYDGDTVFGGGTIESEELKI